MKSSARNIQMTSYDDLFSVGDAVETTGEKVQEIALGELFPFRGHPFKVLVVEPYDVKLHKTVKNGHFVLAGDKGQSVAETGIFKICIFNIVFNHNILSSRIVHIFNDST